MSRDMKKKIVWLPYDFDTAIGINNEGSLVFSYNLEDIDQTEGGADIFNGQQSVLWKNLREMFGPELKAMYQNLRSTGALSYEKVEKMFEDHQAKWPEAIFNEDAWFKYLAPLEEKGSAAYLAMLQGSKAEQRKWWLYNRFKYIDSKYNAGDSLTDVITLRGYAKSNISITPYADVYATVKYGSYLVQTRAARNETYEMVCPLDNVNDTEIYIYSASQLADVGDLSGLKVGYAEFVYATKLQSLKLGDSSRYYANGNLQTLYLGQNKLLKTLDVRNCTGLGTGDQKTVDLSGCTGIEEAYFDGTQVTGVTLPNGGVLRILHLPSSITSLIIRNQPSLTDFTCPGLSGITTLWLENVGSAVDTLSILESLGTGARVRLFNFDWSLEDASEISGVLDTLDDKRGLDQNGDNMPTAQVYGTIHVPSVTGNIISHARERYPDITITYEHVTATVVYLDNDGTELARETITDGGTPISTPRLTTKEDARYNYTFLGWGTSANGAVVDGILDNITSDTTVYAIYSRVEKTFTVRLFNGDVLVQTYTNVGYGSDITYSGTPVFNGTGNAADYVFNGWSPSLTNITSDRDCYAQYDFIGVWFRSYLSGELVTYTDEFELESIGTFAFAGLDALQSVSMPSLLSAPEYAFARCPALSEVNLPSALAVGKYSFMDLPAVKKLALPEMSIINDTTNFVRLTGMTELRLPENTMSLASRMQGLTSLQLLDAGTTSVLGVSMVYSEYDNMETLILRCTTDVVTIPSATSFGTRSPLGNGEGLILVPRSMVDAYKSSSLWTNYKGEIEAIEDHPELCG